MLVKPFWLFMLLLRLQLLLILQLLLLVHLLLPYRSRCSCSTCCFRNFQSSADLAVIAPLAAVAALCNPCCSAALAVPAAPLLHLQLMLPLLLLQHEHLVSSSPLVLLCIQSFPLLLQLLSYIHTYAYIYIYACT